MRLPGLAIVFNGICNVDDDHVQEQEEDQQAAREPFLHCRTRLWRLWVQSVICLSPRLRVCRRFGPRPLTRFLPTRPEQI